MKNLLIVSFLSAFLFLQFNTETFAATQKPVTSSEITFSYKANSLKDLKNLNWNKIHQFFEGLNPDQNIAIFISYNHKQEKQENGNNEVKEEATIHSFSIKSKGTEKELDKMIDDLKNTLNLAINQTKQINK